jgi:HK97 family phage major capsid protein
MKTIKDKLEKRGGLVKEMNDILDKAKTENRKLTAEEQKRWEDLDAEQGELKKEADQLRRQEDLNQEMSERMDQEAIETGSDPEKRKKEEDIAFRSYILKGREGMEPKHRAVLEARSTQITGTGSLGGYLVPTGFQAELEKALLFYVSMWDFTRVIRTTTGNDIPWPMVNDTSNKGELLGEGSNFNAQDITFGQTTLKAYFFDSKVVTVSRQLLQDSALPIEQVVSELLAERIGRILNQYFTTGTGSSQPQGCVTGAVNSSIVSLIAGLTRENIIGLIHSVNAEYRKNGTLMMADSILKAIKLLEVGTSDARPLWQPSMRDGTPDTIDGYRYIINDEMSGLGSGNKIMLFGDFKKFVIRWVTDFILIRLDELYAANLSIGYIGFQRASSHMLNAGTNPIKYLACGTT